MKIHEIIEQQRQLTEKFYPAHLRTILDIKNQFKAVTEAQKIHELFKVASPVTSMPLAEIKSYSKIFDQLEKITHADKFNSIISKANQFSLVNYDFSELIDTDENPDDEKIVINETNRIKRIITDTYLDNSVLLTIEPREFEEVVAELLRSQGFEVELTKQTRDNGYDIIALKCLDSHSPLKFLVECKRYTKQKVGVEIIRSFKEVIATEKANRGILVTTSYFSHDANKKQKETPYLLDYRDKDAVIEWVRDYSIGKG